MEREVVHPPWWCQNNREKKLEKLERETADLKEEDSSGSGKGKSIPQSAGKSEAEVGVAIEPNYKALYHEALQDATLSRLKLAYFASGCRRLLREEADISQRLSSLDASIAGMIGTKRDRDGTPVNHDEKYTLTDGPTASDEEDYLTDEGTDVE